MSFKYTNLPPPPKLRKLWALTAVAAITIHSCIANELNNLYYEGVTDIHGDPQFDKKYLNTDGSFKSEYNNIHIHLNDVSPNYKQPSWWKEGTTECLTVVKTLTVQGEGKTIEIINTVHGDKSGQKIDNNGGAYAKNGGSIKFTKADSIYIASIGGSEFANHSTALTASGANSNIEISGKKVQLIGSIDVKDGKNTSIKVKLSGQESFWYGSAIGETDERTTVNLSLADGATWIFNAGKSTLNAGGIIRNLKLDKGVVLFADAEVWETYRKTVIKGTDYVLANYRDHNERYSQVEIRSLTGPGGIFKMDLDWQSNNGERQYTEKSDFITIGTAEDGSHQIVEFDMGKAHLDEMKNGDKLYFASVESGNTTFSTNADGEVNRADELYRFGLHTQSEEDETDQLTYWFLTKSIGSANENVDFLNNAVLATFSLASDLDRFHERQGEARHEERGTNGLWARYRYSDIGRKHAFDMDKNMIQVGYNKEVSTADSHKIVSLAFDYTRADTDLFGVSGSGSSDRYGLNLYYTVLGESGSYADFNAKIGRLGSDYNLRNDSGQKIGGSLWQTFYGVSAELGWAGNLS